MFGNGDAGELGLGPVEQEGSTPRLNTFLDPDNPAAFRVVQLDCGGMHTVALTEENKIVTWGVNDNGALGRDSTWVEGGLRDIDGDSEEEGELNPLESTPTPLPAQSFPLARDLCKLPPVMAVASHLRMMVLYMVGARLRSVPSTFPSARGWCYL